MQVRGILASPEVKAQLEEAGGLCTDGGEGRAASDPWQAMPSEQPPAGPPPAAAAAGEHCQLCFASPQSIGPGSLCVGALAAGPQAPAPISALHVSSTCPCR